MRNLQRRFLSTNSSLHEQWSPHKEKEWMDRLADEFGLKSMEDWYNITSKHILESGGSSLLTKYSDSPSKILQTLYPNFSWKIWNFNRVPHDYWDEVENQKTFVDWLGNHLGFRD